MSSMASLSLASPATSRPPQMCDSPVASMSGRPHHVHGSGAGGPNVESGEAGGPSRRRSAAHPQECDWPSRSRAPHPHPHNSGSAVQLTNIRDLMNQAVSEAAGVYQAERIGVVLMGDMNLNAGRAEDYQVLIDRLGGSTAVLASSGKL